MRKIYNIFNEDGAGGIDEDEFTMGLRYRLGLNVPEKISDGLFHKMDLDGEGSLSIVELCHYLFPPKEDYQRKTWNVVAEERTLAKMKAEHDLLNQRKGILDASTNPFHAGGVHNISVEQLERQLK